ncbi:hypothetical protein ABTX62_12505 [Streptomyces sp. NPDC096046]|uniref:hypothetical protein n=1 Tax=Streptomyces sp. NPDC096046 TaxID=3155542 RepID=UPI00331A5512
MNETHEQSCGDHVNSDREISAFRTDILLSKSKAEAAMVLLRFDVPEVDFIANFPGLAKKVQELPDHTSVSK